MSFHALATIFIIIVALIAGIQYMAMSKRGRHIMKKKKKIREKKFYLSDLVLLPICIIFLYPFYYMVINTFKTMSEMSFSYGFSYKLFLDNYKDILTNLQIYRAFISKSFPQIVTHILQKVFSNTF